MLEDTDGALWAGTEGGLARVHEGRVTTFTSRDGLIGDDSSTTPPPAAAGVFANQTFTPPQITTIGSIQDGAATTLMVSENIDATVWTSPAEGCVGFTWKATPGTSDKINANTGTGGTGCGLPRPSSFHAGGALFTFCDGHTIFLSEDIDYLVFQKLMTPRGKVFSQTPLSEGDY